MFTILEIKVKELIAEILFTEFLIKKLLICNTLVITNAHYWSICLTNAFVQFLSTLQYHVSNLPAKQELKNFINACG
jgi:hypothetical protein